MGINIIIGNFSATVKVQGGIKLDSTHKRSPGRQIFYSFRFNRVFMILLLISSTFWLFPNSAKVNIIISSNPAGAVVTDKENKQVLGKTPFSFTLDKNSDIGLIFEKEGYFNREAVCKPELKTIDLTLLPYITERIVKTKEAGFIKAGKPLMLDPDAKYLDSGMAENKNKNYKKAADLLRLSFYQKPDSYRFFWYLYFLTMIKAFEVINIEAAAVPEEYLYHASYRHRARSSWANSLKEVGEYEKSIEQYIYLLKNDHERIPDTANPIVDNFWKADRLGPLFYSHKDHKEICSIIVEGLLNDRSEKKFPLNILFTHLVVAASISLESKNYSDALFYTELLKKVDGLHEKIGNIVGFYDRETTIRALDYYINNPPENRVEKPYTFRWLNIYVPEIDGIYHDDNKRFSSKLDIGYVNNRIRDTKQQWSYARVFYYYITDGKVLFEYDYKLLDAKFSRMNKRPEGSYRPDTNSIIPYPVEFLYENLRKYDGVMWWHPAFDGTSYLAGPRHLVLIPGILHSSEWKSSSTMPVGASYNVIIHEIFHNWGHQLGIDSGHNWLFDRKDYWFDSYKEYISKAPDGKLSELLWYRLILQEQGNQRDHSKLFNRDTMSVVSKSEFETLHSIYKEAGNTKVDLCSSMIDEATKAFGNNETERGLKIIESVLRIIPDHPMALYIKAYNIQWKVKNRDKAQEIYNRYLELYNEHQHTDVALVYTLGYYQHRDPQRVIELLTTHGKNPPNNQRRSEYKHFEVVALKNLKRFEEAKLSAQLYLDDPRNTMKQKFVEFIKSL